MVIVDENRLQQIGRSDTGSRRVAAPHAPGQLADKWPAFGWLVLEMDGHDMRDILRTLRQALEENDGHRPTYVLANTVKGNGVSFMENDYTWHSKTLCPEEYATALADLSVGTDTVGQGAR